MLFLALTTSVQILLLIMIWMRINRCWCGLKKMTLLVISETKKLIRLGLIKTEFQTTNTFKILKRMFFFQRRNFGRNAKIFKFSFKKTRLILSRHIIHVNSFFKWTRVLQKILFEFCINYLFTKEKQFFLIERYTVCSSNLLNW